MADTVGMKIGWLGAALWLCGCVTSYPFQGSVRTPQRPEALVGRYEYAVVGSATQVGGWEEHAAEVTEWELPLVLDGEEEVTQVPFEYWRSSEVEGAGPVAIVTPILWGGEGITRAQSQALVAAGYHVVLAKRGTRVLRRSWSIEDVERYLRWAVAGRRALVDWAVARPEVDPGRVVAYGISLGGLVTTVFAAAEPRVQRIVIALAGGDVPGILASADDGRIQKFMETKAAELEGSEADVVARLREVFVSDPLVAARALDPRRVLQITARYDEVVLPRYQVRLWEALGRPTRIDVPTGHYLGILYLPYVMEASLGWLEGALPPREGSR